MIKILKKIRIVIYLCLFSNFISANNKQFINFNDNWLFSETDSHNYSLTTFVPKNWQKIDLPHDWSIDKKFNKKLEGCTGFMPGGIGWYTKYFKTPINENQKCFIIFDGVYNNADFWINGMKFGSHPYGYAPIYYDLTPYLKPKGGKNRISVRVDHSRYADSRWYTGAGIYRNVNLFITDKIYIPVWGTCITTPKVDKKSSTLNIKTKIIKALDTSLNDTKKTFLVSDIFDKNDKKIANITTPFSFNNKKEIVLSQEINIKNIHLWDINNPYLYSVKTYIKFEKSISKDKKESINGKIYNTKMGFRILTFDKDKGFFLNGKFTRIKGVCLHHDAGLVGSAVPKDVWRRRLNILKEGGCNAIRTSHNPISSEFLDLCDEIGILVQEEFYDEWDLPKDKRFNMQDKQVDYITRGNSEHFQIWAEKDLKNTILRDRNHPCIFQWSIGNEIEWTYPGNRLATGIFTKKDINGKMDWTLWRGSTPPNSPEQVKKFWENYPKGTFEIGKTAKKLSNWVKELDTTRVITANCILPTSSFETGYTDALDVVGFSYKQDKYDYFKKTYPTKTMMGTENVCRWYEWKAVLEHKFISGIFLWTGIDYMGECRSENWPCKVTEHGLLDIAGFPRGSYYQFKSLWTEKPTIKIYTQTEKESTFKDNGKGKAIEKIKKGWKKAPRHWQNVNPFWNYKKGMKTIVEVYSNCESLELFLNSKSLGVQYLKDQVDHIYKWPVIYKEGILSAKGTYKGKKVSSELETTKEPVAIKLSSDRFSMSSNNTDVTHIVAQFVDKKGREVKNYEGDITFVINGKYRFLGTDCGNTSKMNGFKNYTCPTNFGHCLLEIQSTKESSKCSIVAYCKDQSIKSIPLIIEIQ